MIALKKIEVSELRINWKYETQITNYYVTGKLDLMIGRFGSNVKTVLFENCCFDDLVLESLRTEVDIHFQNCIVRNLTFSHLSAKIHLVEICSSSVGFVITSPQNPIESLRIDSNKLAQSLTVDGQTLDVYEFINVDLIFTGKAVAINDANAATVTLCNSSFDAKAAATITSSTFKHLKLGNLQDPTLVDCTVDALDFIEKHGTIKIEKNSKVTNLNVLGTVDNSLIIEDSSIFETLNLAARVHNLTINGCHINKIKFNCDETASLSHIRIDASPKQRSRITDLNFKLTSKHPPIHIYHTDIIDLHFVDWRKTNQNVRFDDVRINKLSVRDSDLEGLVFSRIQFLDKRKSLTIENSFLTKGIFNAIQWSQSYKINEDARDYNSGSKDRHLWNLREVYRQLKVISISDHNKIDAARFQQQEVKSYFFYVNSVTWKSTKNWWLYFDRWLVLSTNRVFSNFGQSLALPLFWLLLFHSFFMIAFLPDFGLHVTLFNCDWVSTKQGFDVFMAMLSPVHQYELYFKWMELEPPVKVLGFADSFMRISSSYFIFYFLRATRKFHFGI